MKEVLMTVILSVTAFFVGYSVGDRIFWNKVMNGNFGLCEDFLKRYEDMVGLGAVCETKGGYWEPDGIWNKKGCYQKDAMLIETRMFTPGIRQTYSDLNLVGCPEYNDEILEVNCMARDLQKATSDIMWQSRHRINLETGK